LKNFIQKAFLAAALLWTAGATGQNILDNTGISGSMPFDGAYYQPDEKLGITDSTLDGKLLRMNAFTEVNYTWKNFSAGMRFEAYLPPLLGYDPPYEGVGVPYWFVNYKNDLIEVTAGNFYEEFGNGMTLRTYQEWTLGYDNSIRGLRVKVTPYKGIAIKGVWGVQRYYWEPYKDHNRGIVKGADANFYLNDMFKGMKNSKVKLEIGGSFVSDYQAGKSLDYVVGTDIYTLTLPENVANYGGRINLNIGGFNMTTEYTHKINDPSAMNHYIYKPGNGFYLNLAYSQKGFGITGQMKRIDNMSYKSKRSVTNNMLNINYLPSITKEHTYYLCSMYPYATQPVGEFGFSGQLTYSIKKNTRLGGKTGWNFVANYSQVNALGEQAINDTTPIGMPGTEGYTTSFFDIGKELYYREFSVEATKKFGKKWKGIFTYLNQAYNKDVVEGHNNEYGIIYSNIAVADITWRITADYALRWEIQGLWSLPATDIHEANTGDWTAGLVELTINPHWFFAISDQWNYGNPDTEMRLHYYNVNLGYVYNSTRIALAYGRQREGIICVGGVCRYVPASTGLTLTITSSF
jgi:hypothetical protein